MTRIFVVLALVCSSCGLAGKALVLFGREELTRALTLTGCLFLLLIVACILFIPNLDEQIRVYFSVPHPQTDPAEENPHLQAIIAVERGAYREAIQEYEKVYEKDPNDTFALSELIHLYCDKLHDPATAAAILEQSLNREWPSEDAAFLSSELIAVYWNHQGNLRRARELLIQLIEKFPKTRHAAHAERQLEELERNSVITAQ